MKRSKDRKMLGHSSSFRLKRSSSPYLIIDETSAQNSSDHSTSPRKNPSPDECNGTSYSRNNITFNNVFGLQDKNKKDKSNSSSSLTYRGSPFEFSDFRNTGINNEVQTIINLRRNSDPTTSLLNSALGETRMIDNYDDDEKPLDMSKKSRKIFDKSDDESQTYQELKISFSNQCKQQMRPSVITCAPSLLRSQQSTSPNCQNCGQLTESSKFDPNNKCCNHDNVLAKSSRKQLQINDKTEINDIDEHFRRSLGKDYSEVFSHKSSSNGVKASTSVDDHFAKALGETWLQLQSKTKTTTSNPQSIAS